MACLFSLQKNGNQKNETPLYICTCSFSTAYKITLCLLCQQSTSETLRDPSKCKNKCQSRGYETLAKNFKALASLPLSINISIVQVLKKLSDLTMQNGIKLAMSCVTRQKLRDYAKGKPKSQPQQVHHHLRVGSGEHSLAHLSNMPVCASSVML